VKLTGRQRRVEPGDAAHSGTIRTELLSTSGTRSKAISQVHSDAVFAVADWSDERRFLGPFRDALVDDELNRPVRQKVTSHKEANRLEGTFGQSKKRTFSTTEKAFHCWARHWSAARGNAPHSANPGLAPH